MFYYAAFSAANNFHHIMNHGNLRIHSQIDAPQECEYPLSPKSVFFLILLNYF